MSKHLKVDVLVCGAGSAGVVAALAAARSGAKTLVVERAPFAGGIVTATGLPFFDDIAHADSGKIVVKGIPFEIAVQLGLCQENDTQIYPHNPRIRNVEQFKILTDDLLTT
ncbi:MAG: FAD-dependent oxidoreductase, partial [Candidatus Latescibacteria bacterium]|nr:FAD-dependent oxidoreductase [Candidatus Latescibacterota bacterium]